MSKDDKKEDAFTEEQLKDVNQKLNDSAIPEFDVKGTLESLEAYSHFLDQCPEEQKEKVLEDVQKQTDAWQKVFDGFKEALKDPESKQRLRKMIIDGWKK